MSDVVSLNSTKKEIEEWLDKKSHEFMERENRNLRVSKEQWLERTYIRKFMKFSLHPSPLSCTRIVKLANIQGRCRLDKPILWTPELVRKLEASRDKIVRVVYYWLNQIIGGFITEFAIDTSVSYKEAE